MLSFTTKLTVLYFVSQISRGDSALHKVLTPDDPGYNEFIVKRAIISEFPALLSAFEDRDGVVRTRRGDIRRVTAKSRDRISKKLQDYRIQDFYSTFKEKLEGRCEFMKNDGRYVTRYIHGTKLKKEFWYTPILQWTVNNAVKMGRCYIAPSERPTRVGVPLIFEDGPMDESGRHTVIWTAYGDKQDLFEFNGDSERPSADSRSVGLNNYY